jgi:hypothetical protein
VNHLNPWELLAIFVIFVALPATVFFTVIWRLVRTSLGLKQLAELGPEGRVETEAVVLGTEERHDKIRGAGTHRCLVRYEYRDGFGNVRRARAEVPEPAFRGLVEGGPLLVAYSPRQPGTSAPVASIEEAAARFAARARASGVPGEPDA